MVTYKSANCHSIKTLTPLYLYLAIFDLVNNANYN